MNAFSQISVNSLTSHRAEPHTVSGLLKKRDVMSSEPIALETASRDSQPATPAEPASMEELLLKVATGDRIAFREVFDHFAPRLKAYIMSQGSDLVSAEEVVQEALVKVWRKASQFDPNLAAASTWVFTIARNMRIDHLRKANRPEPDMTDPAFVPDPEAMPSEILSRSQDAKILHSAIKKLSAEQQDVLRLAYFEEKAHPEIAAALEIPLGTVKSRVRLALKNIRSHLEDRT